MRLTWDCSLLRSGTVVEEHNFTQTEAEAVSHEAEEETEGLGLFNSDNPLKEKQVVDNEAPKELDEPLDELATDNVRDTIDRLYRLSFRIRNAATRLGSSEAKRYQLIAEDGTDLMESFAAIDLTHVGNLMAKHLKTSPEESRNHFLVKRLAKANTTRRQQFGFWRRHRSNVEQRFERTGGSKNNELHNDGGTTSPHNPNTKSRTSTTTRIDAPISLNDSQSLFPSSPHIASSREDQEAEILIPRLPDKVRGRDFECPYCNILCPGRISDGPAWK